MKEHSKRTKRLLHAYMIEAYERELHRELTRLDAIFEEWRRGKISGGELSQRVHEYDRGPSRELYKRYNAGMNDQVVAYAIVTGILDADQVPGELLEALQAPIAMFRGMKERGDLREPGE